MTLHSNQPKEEKGMANDPLTLISIGVGVQSTTVAMMAAYGEITPMPDAAIFADTGAEPGYVYDTLDWLVDLLPFPVYTVQKDKGLKAGILRSTIPNEHGDFIGRFAGAPFYTTSDSDTGMGMLRRQCTREFKIEPITQKVRELVGLQPRQRAPKGAILAEQWIGISWDEKQRMKLPREKWLRHRWPLIELGMTRGHCLDWMQRHNLPLPSKSACTFCPYRSKRRVAKSQGKPPRGLGRCR